MSPTRHSQEQGAVHLRLLEVQLGRLEAAHVFSETAIPSDLHLQRQCCVDVVYDIGERRWIESLFVSRSSYLSQWCAIRVPAARENRRRAQREPVMVTSSRSCASDATFLAERECPMVRVASAGIAASAVSSIIAKSTKTDAP